MKQLRILIVDDDRDYAESMAELVEIEGYQAVLAYNGMDALKLFKQNNIDLILLDYKMPGLSGIDVLKEIKNYNSSVPVVIMSAFLDTDLLKLAIQTGADEVLDKPVNISKVTSIISSIKNIRNVLILDDDKDFADSLSSVLSNTGYKVYVAYNYEQAINLVMGKEIQLLLLDLKINGETGIDLWHMLRKMHIDVPTIFISGYMDDFFKQIEAILVSSNIDVIKKPFDTEELINKIRNLKCA